MARRGGWQRFSYRTSRGRPAWLWLRPRALCATSVHSKVAQQSRKSEKGDDFQKKSLQHLLRNTQKFPKFVLESQSVVQLNRVVGYGLSEYTIELKHSHYAKFD